MKTISTKLLLLGKFKLRKSGSAFTMMEVRLVFSAVFLILVTEVQPQRGFVLNKYCTEKRDCAPFGYVCEQNQTCQCDKFYALNKYGDKCVGGVGQKCRYDEHCIEGAYCDLQITCKCKDDLYPVEDGFACSKSISLVSASPHLYVITSLLFYLMKIV